jgi:putative acetyltransferase
VRARDLTTVPIRRATSAADVAQARALFEEYAAGLGVDLCFQGFAQELAALPGAYAPPRGVLLLAGPPGAAVACVALRPLPNAGPDGDRVGEVKRLYVRPDARGGALGERLVRTLLDDARAAGYRELKLDTLASMASARRLYERLGFGACSPYYENPLAGVVYMSRRL